MIFISIMIFSVVLTNSELKKGLAPLLMIRLSGLVFLISALISGNLFYLAQINSGIGIYSGLFQITNIHFSFIFRHLHLYVPVYHYLLTLLPDLKP